MIVDRGKPLYGLVEGHPCQHGRAVRFMSTGKCAVCYRFGVDERIRLIDKKRLLQEERTSQHLSRRFQTQDLRVCLADHAD
jgi:hypothetical protein